MISTLIKREIKSGYKLLLIFMGVLTLYASMIVAMFDPKLGESLEMMAESMPQIFSAFGMMNVGSTLIEFVANYLYGFLLIVFPLVFIIMLASRLMAKYVDRGSMAYLLATPHKRWKIALTQAFNLLLFLFILAAYVTGLIIALSEIMFSGALDIPRFLILNLAWFGLIVFMSGVCFCFACIFNESKLALGVGGGLCVAFVLIQMVSQVGAKFENLKYATPLTLFSADKVIAGESEALLMCAALFAFGLALYAAGITVFAKKDLNV